MSTVEIVQTIQFHQTIKTGCKSYSFWQEALLLSPSVTDETETELDKKPPQEQDQLFYYHGDGNVQRKVKKKDRAPESISHLRTSQGWLFIISILYNICDKQQFISVFFVLSTHTALISLYAQLKCHHHLLKTFLISSPK